MIQAKFTLEDGHVDFLNDYKKYGFKDRSSAVRAALNLLKKELEIKSLMKSAELYAEIYESDAELQTLAEESIAEWPE